MAHMNAKDRRGTGSRYSRNEIATANNWRRSKIDALVAACESGDDQKITTARLPLLLSTDSPEKTGFSRSDLEHFVSTLTKRLDGGFVRQDGSKSHGIRSAFSGKMHALGRVNDRISHLQGRVKHDVLKERDRIACEAKDIHQKVDVLEYTIQAIKVSMDERLRPRQAVLQPIHVPEDMERHAAELALEA